MKINPFIFLFFIVLAFTANSQTQKEYYFGITNATAPQWAASTTTSDGALVMVGHYQKAINNNLYLVPVISKMNNNGTIDWYNPYLHFEEEEPEYDLIPKAIVTTFPDEGFAIIGEVYDRTDNGLVYLQPFVLKVSPDGYHEYTKFYGCETVSDSPFSLSCEELRFNDLAPTLTGGLVVVGSTAFLGETNLNGIVFQLDNSGERINHLSRIINHPDFRDTEAVALKPVLGDNYIILFNAQNPTSPNSWFNRTMVVRINQAFQTVWSNEIYEADHESSYIGRDLVINSEHEVYILGQLGAKIFITELSSSGHELGTMSYINEDMNQTKAVYIPKITRDSDDNLYVGVYGYEKENDRLFPAIFKLNNNGMLQWANRYGNPNDDSSIKDIVIVNNGALSLNGMEVAFVGSTVMGPNSGAVRYGWTVRLHSADGSMACSYQETSFEISAENFHSRSVETDGGGVILTYSYHGIYPGEFSGIMTACDFFFFSSVSSLESTTASKAMDIELAPNPSKGSFQLSVKGLLDDQDSQIDIFDVAGRHLQSIPYPNPNEVLYLSDFQSGMYLIRAVQGNRTKTRRLIVH